MILPAEGSADTASIWRRKVYATRVSAHVAFAAIVWPLATLAGTTVALMALPYFHVSLPDALLWAFAGTILSAPDMLLVGAIIWGFSFVLFSRLGVETRGKRLSLLRLGLEPLLAAMAIVAGASLWYPAMLSVPLLLPLGNMPAASVIALLMAVVALGACITAAPGKRIRLAVALIAAGILSPVPMRARAELVRLLGSSPSAVVLGIDSVSQTDDVRRLEEWVNGRGGAWYKRAVAPGLLTNAVWSSVLTMKPVRQHAVFLTFMKLPAGAPAFLSGARARGYRTISAFSDQLTCSVGSRAGFDEDRSGPVGWRQLLLPIVANNSFLVPVLKPALPYLWPMAMPPNQAGTITYDVRREIREIFRAGTNGERTLVAAHLTYAHLPAYPSSAELSWAQLRAIARAPAKDIFDRSFDWKDIDLPTDPVPLHRWKIAHLQDVIASEVDAVRYIEEGGRLVVFSDHGDRADLTPDTFHEKRYHHVLLATFGLPSRCPERSISLADIGSLLGLADGRTDPSVEFMYTPETLVPNLVKASRVRWSGDVDIDHRLASRLFGELRRHQPWQEELDGNCGTGTTPQSAN